MIKLVFFLAFIIRILIIYLSQSITNFDLQSYLMIGKATLTGTNIYPHLAVIRYPYFPFFLYFQALAIYLEKFINPIIFLKILVNIFDLGNGYLIFFLTNKNLKKTAFYLFNPASVLIFTFHGQFDALSIFFILLSIYFFKKEKELLATVSFALAIVIKVWPIFFLFIFLKSLKNKYFSSMIIVIIGVFVLIYSLLFHSPYFDIIKSVITYRSLFDFWGLGLLIKLIFFRNYSQTPLYVQKISLYSFLLFFFIYSAHLSYQKINIFEKINRLLLFFYIFTFGFSVQYLSWIIPFLVILDAKKFLIKTLGITLYLIVNYGGWIEPLLISPILSQTFGLVLWFGFFICWFSKNKAR